jgi:hypothetical protein
MNQQDIIFHMLNFVAPAVVLAVLVPVLGWIFLKRGVALLPWWGQMLVNLLVGVAVLLGGLWWFDRDGKMQTYAALALAVASSQWLLARSWRR